jgi:hypothetical protein
MYCRRWLLLASFLAAFPVAQAEARCPGNVASVHTRRVGEYLNLVTVTLNRFGSYPFLLDTGAQITTVDPALAAELHLQTSGTRALIGVVAQQRILIAELDELSVGDHRTSHLQVAIQPLDTLQSAMPGVRGVLGGDFLRHFDVLIDQGNSLLCLDTEGNMRGKVHGERLNLTRPPAEADKASTEPLIIAVSLSGMPERPLFLLLDSGTNVPFLWKAPHVLPAEPVIANRFSSGHGFSTFNRLSPRDIYIGRLLVHHVTFASFAVNAKDLPMIQGDGLMPTAQFRRTYIDYSDRYVVLEPW